MVGGGKKAVRIFFRDERGPGLFKARLHFGFEWIDHLVLLVELMSLHASLCWFLRNRMKNQFEFALLRRDGLFDRSENMRCCELIHPDRQRGSGFAEERF